VAVVVAHQAGRSVNAARKLTLLVCGLCVLPMVVASQIHDLWVTVAIISLAAAAHQGWSADLYTLVSDTFPRRVVGSVTGFGGMAGAVGGMVAAAGIGHVLDWTGKNYDPLLFACGFAYLFALVVIHLLAPRLAPARVETATGS
jgi:ACS family hexuronate transporter-like MFS transporter